MSQDELVEIAERLIGEKAALIGGGSVRNPLSAPLSNLNSFFDLNCVLHHKVTREW